MLIEIFETKKHALPRDIYFVPSTANGAIDHDTYYQYLRLHHTHVANLRSFAIMNVSDIKAEITIYDPDGTNPRVMSFEQALLSKSYGDTNKPLFYSIEPTQGSITEGCYLLITNKNVIKEAETFIDMALTSLNSNYNNIARTNRINTSETFQEYANKLKNMIPKMINLPKHPGHNAWKRRPPTKVNLMDEDFPPLTTPKKTKTLDSMEQDNTTATGQTNLLTDVDVERIKQRQKELAATLTAEIKKLRQENETDLLTDVDDVERIKQRQNELASTLNAKIKKLRQEIETMQKTPQAQFKSALQALELRIEHWTQQIVSSMGQTINQAIDHRNAQSAHSDDERINNVLQSFQNQADCFTSQMVSPPDDAQSNSPNPSPVRRTRARIWESPLPSLDAIEEWEDTMDEDDNNNNLNSFDGRHKIHASCTHHTQEMDTTTGGAL
jgi:hypothetical protein